MGIMTEFFVSRPRDVKGVDWAEACPSDWFPAVEVSGITPESVLELEELLTGIPIAKLEKRDAKLGRGFVEEASDGERWVHVLSEKLGLALLELKSAAHATMTRKWLGHDEDVPLLGDLAALARIAARANENQQPKAADAWRLYLWGSV